MIAALLLLQAAQPAAAQPATGMPPEIQLDIRATARRVVIENDGRPDLQVRTSVNGREGEGNVVDVQAPEVPQGRATLNNVEVRVRAEARIADPLAAVLQSPQQPEPEQEPQPQP
jgi:hypothetical protein